MRMALPLIALLAVPLGGETPSTLVSYSFDEPVDTGPRPMDSMRSVTTVPAPPTFDRR